MATRDDVYRKFGEASEAAQLLETELGTLLVMHKCIEASLLEYPDSEKATGIYKQITRKTLGQLIRSIGTTVDSIGSLEELLKNALAARNRLAHNYFLQHNLRINSDDGRDVMLLDLETIHNDLLNAYKAAMLLSGYDLDKIVAGSNMIRLPTGHLPIPYT